MTSVGQLTAIARRLVRDQTEGGWVEYKTNNVDPTMIGERVSALSNGAARAQRPRGFIVWGVEDGTREVIGTQFDPASARVGGEELEHWLYKMVSPRIELEFGICELEGKRIVLLLIERAFASPTRFKGVEYIRVGSYTKHLSDFPEMARQLWRTFETTPFERLIQHEGISGDEVVRLLRTEDYFELLGQPTPPSRAELLNFLEQGRMVQRNDDAAGWNITNLGALCLARKLSEFDRLARKAIRVVQYADPTRTNALDGHDGVMGYAAGFAGLLGYLHAKTPRHEVTDPIRRTVESFPAIALRELVSNAIIHQDLTVSGAGPMVEVFPDRVEISNPGSPLVDTRRLLDAAPQSRNEAMAMFMRRIGICEERGSGVDKAATAAEEHQLPAPSFRASGNSTMSIVYGPRQMAQMDKSEQLWTVYLHASLRYVNQQEVSNATLRARFGLDDRASSRVSKLLGEALEEGLIVPRDPNVGYRSMRYLPYWAADTDNVA